MNDRPDPTDRPDPLDRLEALRGVDTPDQWDDIVARAAEPELTRLHPVDPPGDRRRWLVAAAAAAVLVLGAGVMIAVNTGDDDGEITALTDPSTVPVLTTAPFEPIPSTAPSSVSPPSTVTDAAPTTTDAAMPPATTVPAPANPLVSSCPDREVLSAPAFGTSPPANWTTFGPLGLEPNLVLRLPNGAVAADGVRENVSIVRGITQIPGGLAVLFQPLDSATAWELVAVGADGTILWRRCGSEQAFEMYSTGADVIHVRETAADWSAWRAFDVLSGSDAAPLTADAAGFALDVEDRFVLRDAPGGLELVDLADGLVTDVALPEFDGEFTSYTLDGRGGGVPAIVAQDEYNGPTVGVYVDGAWRTDRDTLLAEREIQVNENSALYGPDPELGNGIHARDALGATVWFHETEGPLMTEGFHTGVFGDVVLSNACREAVEVDGVPTCEQEGFVALDLLTGDVLWERPGFADVGPAGDGLALVTTETGWEMVELRTGEPVAGQAWGELTFSTFCCGEGDYVWAARDGGVVWAVDYDTIRVHYPEGAAGPTTEVDLSR